MVWRKIDWVALPRDRDMWWKSHAAFPTVTGTDGNQAVVLVSTRNRAQRSSCAFMSIILGDGDVTLIDYSRTPLLEPGDPGHFDCDGVNVTFASGPIDDVTVWYHGWMLLRDGGWINSIGTARGDLKSGFIRTSPSPVFDRSPDDPTSLGYPFWYRVAGHNCLFYCSYEQFGNPTRGDTYSYRVRLADESLQARGNSLLCHEEGMMAQSRPSVVEYHGDYLMFVAVKGSAYHIRCARSSDGLKWEWADSKWWLTPAGSENEINEVAYPYVFLHHDRLTMFYNGDSHGKTGFGVAVWDD